MGNKVITIGREYGCGGRLVAKKLAEKLGFAYYDSDLISLAAEKTGMTESYVKEIEQKKVSNFLYSLFLPGQTLTLPDQVFIAQAEVIRAAAAKESCVFVGRCADYILKDFDNCVNLFLHAPLETRIHRTEVSVTFDKHISHRKVLRKTNERVIDRCVAVRMISTKHVTYARRRLFERLVAGKPVFVHSVQNSSVHGLKTVANVGQRSSDNDRHGVFYITSFHFPDKLALLDKLVGECDVFGLIISVMCHNKLR